MAEVLEGEIVPSAPSNTLENRSPITPKKQELILGIVNDADPSKGQLFTLTSLARKAKIPHKAFIAALHRALEDPRDKLHGFALDVFEMFGAQQDHLVRDAYEAAKKSGRWEAFMTLLERIHREDFVKPSERAAPAGPAVNIGVVEKMAVLGGNRELTTGD